MLKAISCNSHPKILQYVVLLTGWITGQTQGNRQSLNLRIAVRRERSKKLIRVYGLVCDYPDNVLNIGAMFEEWVGWLGYDQSLNPGESDLPKRRLE